MDWLVAAAAILAVAVAGLAADRASDRTVALPRAQWACTRTHPESRLRFDPLSEGGSVAELVSEPICDTWTKR